VTPRAEASSSAVLSTSITPPFGGC